MAEKGKLYELRRKIQVLALKLTSHEFMSKVYYFITYKRRLNLKKPKYFNEKMQWLKLNYFPYDEKVIQGADKYRTREYVKEKGLEYTLNELIGVWDDWAEVDWDSLPRQFALKGNHGQAYNIICDDKSKLSEREVGEQVSKWLSEDFGLFNAEKHYSKIKPKVIAEKYLGGEITDYKFFCFHGVPKFFYVASGFGQGKNERMDFFNMDGTKASFRRQDFDSFTEEIKLPDNMQEMVEISRILSSDFPFVRVDLFVIDGKILFSELTFTPSAGLMKIEPKEYYEVWGNYLNINKVDNLRI